MRQISFLTILMAITTTLGSYGMAADISVQLQVPDRQVVVGVPFNLAILVDGARVATPSQLPTIDGLSVRFDSGTEKSSSSVITINGRTQRNEFHGYVMNFRATPTREGRIDIPALTVEIDGHPYTTRPASIQAIPPQTSKDFQVRLSFPERAIYVGEPVPVYIDLLLHSEAKVSGLEWPFLSTHGVRFDAGPQSKNTVDTTNLDAIENVPVDISTERINGSLYRRIRLPLFLTAHQPGTLAVSPAHVTFLALEQRTRVRDPFESFFQSPQYQYFGATSDTHELRVLPVPQEGRPAGYYGLVGDCSLVAKAAPVTAHVGDPIRFEILATGAERMEDIRLPNLAAQPEFAESFEFTNERPETSVKGPVKTFAYTIRPKNESVRAIPSVKVPYFNPRTKSFQIARTEAIPLTIKPTRIITLKDAEGLESTDTDSGSESNVTPSTPNAPHGLRPFRSGPRLLVPEKTFSLWTLVTSRASGIVILPLCFLVVAALLRIRRFQMERTHAFRSRAAALQDLHSTLEQLQKAHTQPTVDTLSSILTNGLAHAYQLPSHATTSMDIDQALAVNGCSTEIRAQWASLFAACEQARYGNHTLSSEDASGLIRSALAAIDAMKQEVPR